MSCACVTYLFFCQDCTAQNTINGHEYVDMGLSVKWATCNVGAQSPSDYGNYYAWGETATRSRYNSDNSKTYGKRAYRRDIGGDVSLDAARANWGSTWRLPTKDELDELIDGCTWQWTTQGGHAGYRFTSRVNGNSIFLPAAGCRGAQVGDMSGSSLSEDGVRGFYWSSSPVVDISGLAYNLYIDNSDLNVGGYLSRCCGISIRPVSK